MSVGSKSERIANETKVLGKRNLLNNGMSALFSMRLRQALQSIQAELAFESWHAYPKFNSSRGLGRVALLASYLGIALGTHFVCLFMLLLERFGGYPHSILPGAGRRRLRWPGLTTTRTCAV